MGIPALPPATCRALCTSARPSCCFWPDSRSFSWLGSRATPKNEKLHLRLLRPVLAVVGAALLAPLFGGWTALGNSLVAIPLSCLGIVALLSAGWRYVGRYREDHDPLYLGLVLSTVAGIAAEMITIGSLDGGVGLGRGLLICGMLAPLAASLHRDFLRLRRSIPAQLRIAFSAMILLVLVGTAITLEKSGAGPHATDAAGLDARSRIVALSSFVIAMVLTVMALSTVLCRRFLDNLESLVDATRKLAQGKLNSLVERKGGNELNTLTGAFNAMAERVFLQNRELRILARVMDGTSDPVLILAPDLHIVYSNDAFTKITGWSRRTAIGRRFRDLFLDDNAEQKLEQMRGDIEGGQTWTGELTVRTRETGPFESFATVSPVVHEGKTIQYVAVHRDLSTLKRLESERLAFAENIVRIHTLTQDLVRSLDIREVSRDAIRGLRESFGIEARVWSVGGGDRCHDCGFAEVCDAYQSGPCLELDNERARLPIGVGVAGLAASSSRRFVCPSPRGPARDLSARARGVAPRGHPRRLSAHRERQRHRGPRDGRPDRRGRPDPRFDESLRRDPRPGAR